MIRLYFIRHGATEGNQQRRYIGRTEEKLSESGRAQIEKLKDKNIKTDILFVSPMLRARESAEILFPSIVQHIVPELRETDFGSFEGKTADELKDCPEYNKWLESMCLGDIPGGESVKSFKERACSAFEECLRELPDESTAAFVTHGGVIMAILQKFARPEGDFYDYHINNGEYIAAEYCGGIIKVTDREG